MEQSIDIQIRDLEKEKERLEKQAKENEKIKNFNTLKNEFEGKVKCSIFKRKTSNSFTATWFKKVVMKEDGNIYVPRETAMITVDHHYKRYSMCHDVIGLTHYNCKLEKIIDQTMFEFKKEITIEQFKAISTSNISYTEAIILFASGKEFIKVIQNGIEHDMERKIEETGKLLDIPHIFLTQNEAWLLDKSVFLNDLCFLLTKASISFANTILNKKLRNESNSRNLLADFGYRHRNDRTEEIYALQSKLREAFLNIK